MSVVSVVCCQLEVSATHWSHVQRSPTDSDVSLCVWSRNLKNEEAMVRLGSQRHREGKKMATYCTMTGSLTSSNENTSWVRDFGLRPRNSWELHSSGLLRSGYGNFLQRFRDNLSVPSLEFKNTNQNFLTGVSGQTIGPMLRVQESISRFSKFFKYIIIPFKMYFLRLQTLSSFSNNLCFSSGQRSCVGMFATEHN